MTQTTCVSRIMKESGLLGRKWPPAWQFHPLLPVQAVLIEEAWEWPSAAVVYLSSGVCVNHICLQRLSWERQEVIYHPGSALCQNRLIVVFIRFETCFVLSVMWLIGFRELREGAKISNVILNGVCSRPGPHGKLSLNWQQNDIIWLCLVHFLN